MELKEFTKKIKLKKIFKMAKEKVTDYIKNNYLFSVYLVLSVITTFTVRLLTTKSVFDYRPLITDLGLIIIFGSFSLLYKTQKQKYTYLKVWLILYTAMGLANDIYYAFYSSFASFSELSSLGQATGVTNSFIERIEISQFVYILAPVAFSFIYRRYTKKKSIFNFPQKDVKKKLRYTLIIGLLFVLLSFSTTKIQDYSRLYKLWNRTYVVDRFGIITYEIMDSFTSVTTKINTIFGFENALIAMDEFYNQIPKYTESNKYTGIFEGYNIIFVHLESIQSFLLDQSFNGQDVLPTTKKLINEGLYFSNFYPEISTGTSSDTEFSLLTSLLPTRFGIVFTNYYDRDYVTIPKILNEKGYYTFSMHGNDFTMWSRNNAHPSLGYKNFYFKDKYTFDESQTLNLGIKDDEFFRQSVKYLEQIENENSNYMGTVITLSNHSPYIYLDGYAPFALTKEYKVYNEKTQKYEKKKLDYLTGTTIGNYIISSHSADLDLGVFIDEINKSKNFNNTIFVFYGDHDARLSQDQFNYYYNFNPVTNELRTEDDPEYYDYNYFVHMLSKKTPLIIWSKNENVRNLIKGEIDYPMGMIDIMPTIGNMFGFKNEYALGHDIFNIKNENIVPFPNGDYLTYNYFYSSAKDAVYTLKDNAIITDRILNENAEYVNERIEISNNIIIHDLIKHRKINKKNKTL